MAVANLSGMGGGKGGGGLISSLCYGCQNCTVLRQ